MDKKDNDSLESSFKSIHTAISKPSRKIAGAIGKYLDALNPLTKSEKPKEEKEIKDIVRTQKHNNITWTDIENPTRKTLTEIGEKYSFNTFHLRGSLNRGQVSRIDFEEKYVFIVLNIPRLVSHDSAVTSSQVCVFLGKDYLITIHSGKPESLRSIFSTCMESKEDRETLFKRSPGYLLHGILEVFVKEIGGILQSTSQELDQIEDIVFDVKKSATYRISALRQKIIRLRRIIGPMRVISQDLYEAKPHSIGEGMGRYYKNLYNVLSKLWDTLEEVRETAEIYKDTDFTVSSERTNKILAVLTVIFTLTIPLTIIGTFYGMNVLLPGGIETGPWVFLGEYTTFFIIISVSALSVLAMLWYFKYKDWF